MKRMSWLARIALALPMAAFANSGGVDFTNSGGTLTGSSENEPEWLGPDCGQRTERIGSGDWQ